MGGLVYHMQGERRGGLGLKNSRGLNYALLGKWLRRLKTEGQHLWVTVLKEKYGSEGRDLRKNQIEFQGGGGIFIL